MTKKIETPTTSLSKQASTPIASGIKKRLSQDDVAEVLNDAVLSDSMPSWQVAQADLATETTSGVEETGGAAGAAGAAGAGGAAGAAGAGAGAAGMTAAAAASAASASFAGLAGMAGVSGGVSLGNVVAGLSVVALAKGKSADEPLDSLVSVKVVAGPVVNANSLKVYLYDSTGALRTKDGLTINDKGSIDGAVSFGDYKGVVVAKLAGANDNVPDYLDEATGNPADLDIDLYAAGTIETAGTEITLNLNILALLAYYKAGGVAFNLTQTPTVPTEAVVNSTNTAIAHLFGLESLHKTDIVTVVGTSSNPTNYSTTDGVSEAEKYGEVLAALSGADLNNGGNGQTTLTNLLAGITVPTSGPATLSDAAFKMVNKGADTVDQALGLQTLASVAGDTNPTILSVAIDSATGGQGSTLNAGDVLTFNVRLSETVLVTGTPQLAVTIGSSVVQADYASGTGSKTLTFTYTILAGQTDADGVSVSADSLTLNGGTIVSKDSNSALILSHDLVSDSVNFLVDTTAPATTVSNIGISVDTGSSAADFITKTASQTITATLSASLVAGEVLLGSVDGGSTWTDITTSASGTAISWTGATLAGSSSIQLKVSDAAGNDGAVQSQTYVLDTSVASVSGIAISDDTGASATDFITQTAAQTAITATLSAALENGDKLEGSVNGGNSWTDITSMVASNGTSISWTGQSLVGSSSIKFKVTDGAGNTSSVLTQAYVLDTTATITPVAWGDSGQYVAGGSLHTSYIKAAGPVITTSDANMPISIGGVAVGVSTPSLINGSSVLTLGALTAAASGAISATDLAGNTVTAKDFSSNDILVSLGTTGGDTLSGHLVWGFEGNDTITGTTADDYLYGGDDNDTFTPAGISTGTGGFDFIQTGTGNDQINLAGDSVKVGVNAGTKTLTSSGTNNNAEIYIDTSYTNGVTVDASGVNDASDRVVIKQFSSSHTADTLTGSVLGTNEYHFAWGNSDYMRLGADVITNFKVGDKIVLSDYANQATVNTSIQTATSASGAGVTFTTGYDSYTYKNGTSIELYYETTVGTAGGAGSLEHIVLQDPNSTINGSSYLWSYGINSATGYVTGEVSVAQDTTAPTFVKAETSADGTKVILTYSEALNTSTAATTDFVVQSGATGSLTSNTVTAVAVKGSTLELTLTTAIVTGNSVTVAYTDPTPSTNGSSELQDGVGNDAADLSTTAVTNMVPPRYITVGSAGIWEDTDKDGVKDSDEKQTYTLDINNQLQDANGLVDFSTEQITVRFTDVTTGLLDVTGFDANDKIQIDMARGLSNFLGLKELFDGWPLAGVDPINRSLAATYGSPFWGAGTKMNSDANMRRSSQLTATPAGTVQKFSGVTVYAAKTKLSAYGTAHVFFDPVGPSGQRTLLNSNLSTYITFLQGLPSQLANGQIEYLLPQIVSEQGSGDLSDELLNNAESASTTFRVTLPATGSQVQGDSLELLLNGNAFGTPKTATLNSNDISNGYVDFTVLKADLGADGAKALSAKITDVAGNVGTASTAVSFTLDTTAPSTTISSMDISADTGSSAADFITKTAAQTITATLSTALTTGETLWGSVDGGSTWTDITTSASGTAISWTTATLSGTSSIKLKVSDAAGNDGAVQSQTYVLDTSAPTLSSSTPTDGASAIAIASNIVLTFSETVSAGTGNIVISNGTDTRTISVSDSQVTISGNKVTINPLTDLTAGSNYHVKVDATALKDSAGNDFAGISNTTDLNFSTAAAPSKLYYTVGMVNGSAAVWKEDVDASTGSFLSGTAGVFDGNDIQLQATDFLGSGFKQITAANASVNDVTVRFNIVNGERLDLSGFGSGDKVIIDMQTHASTFMGITYPAGFANATNVRSIKKIQFSTSAFYKGFEAKTGAGGGLRKYVGIAVGGSARAGIYYSCNNIGVPISIAIGFNRNNSSLEYLLP